MPDASCRRSSSGSAKNGPVENAQSLSEILRGDGTDVWRRRDVAGCGAEVDSRFQRALSQRASGFAASPELTQAFLRAMVGKNKATSSASAKTVASFASMATASAKTVASAETIRDAAGQPVTAARLEVAAQGRISGASRSPVRRTKSMPSGSLGPSTYDSEYVDVSSRKAALSVPKTIHGYKKDLDMLIAAIGGDPRRAKAAADLQRRMGSTEYKKNFNTFTQKQMKDALGTSPDIEERSHRIAQIFARVKDRAAAQARERRKAEKQKLPQKSKAATPSVDEAAAINRFIANDFVKGAVATPKKHSAASKSSKARSHSNPPTATQRTPKATATRAKKRMETKATQLKALLDAASCPSVPCDVSGVAGSGTRSAPLQAVSDAAASVQSVHSQVAGTPAPAIQQPPSIVPNLLAMIESFKKHQGAESAPSEAKSTAVPESKAASLHSDVSTCSTVREFTRSHGVGTTGNDASSSSSKTLPYTDVHARVRSRPSSAKSSGGTLSVTTDALIAELEGLRALRREISSEKSLETSTSKNTKMAESQHRSSQAVSASCTDEAVNMEISPSKSIVSTTAPYATPFRSEFEDWELRATHGPEETTRAKKRPVSAPVHGRASASQVVPPYAAPFSPAPTPKVPVSDLEGTVARGSALAAARSRSASALVTRPPMFGEGARSAKRPSSAGGNKHGTSGIRSELRPGSVAHWTRYKSLI